MTSTAELGSFVDLERYPLEQPGHAALVRAVERARQQLRGDGCAVVRGLVCGEAVDRLDAEIVERKPTTHYSTSMMNPYFHTTADPNLLQVLEHYIEDLLSRLPRGQRIEGRLRQYVMKSLKNGPPRLAEAARCLGMSPRTLQRRLKDKGLIFDRVVDETRCQLAESYLESSKLTASEIAYLLGYSELSAFTRAYRRWTGSTPKATRRRAKP